MNFAVYALVAALSMGSGWLINGWRLGKNVAVSQNKCDNTISDMKIKELDEAKQALGELNERFAKLQDAKDIAEKAAAERKIALDIVLHRANVTNDGVSNAANEALRRSELSHKACLANTSAFRDVFQSCREEALDVAKEADGHVIDKLRLDESFPVETKKEKK